MDRSQAERLRGIELAAPAVDVPGTLWVHELVGATLVSTPTGTTLGTVQAVEANPASDLLVLESGGLVPLRFVTDERAAAGTLVVDIPDGLLDLSASRGREDRRLHALPGRHRRLLRHLASSVGPRIRAP